MGIRKVQSAFMGGEISPAMYGRFDDQKYGQGLAVCRNFIPRPQGPVINRPGFEFVREAKFPDKPTRLIPFQFSGDQTMVVELGEKYARFHTRGQTLLADGGAPYEIATPYESRDVMDLRFVQAGDVMTLVHSAYPPMELRRYGAVDWRLVPINFQSVMAPPKNVTGSFKVVKKSGYDLKEEEKTRYDYKYKITAVKNALGANTGVDNEESFPSEVCSVKGNLYLENATVTLNWASVEGAERYRVYKSYKGLFGFIGETTVTSFVDDNYKADEERTPPLYDDPFSQGKGIKSVRVLDGGSGFPNHALQMRIERNPEGALRATAAAESGQSGYYGRSSGRCRQEAQNLINGKTFRKEAVCELPVYDKDGRGGGAVVEFDCSYGVEGSYRVRNGGNGNRPTYFFSWITSNYYSLSNPRILKFGSGYSRPYVAWPSEGITADTLHLRTTDGAPIKEGGKTTSSSAFWGNSTSVSVAKYTAQEKPERFITMTSVDFGHLLRVSDKTGFGAQLEPVVEDGKIKSVNIRYPGVGYTAPTITTVGQGSGAKFEVTIADVGDYPSAVAYFEQRRVFGGTSSQPQSLWMTRSGTESDMTYTLPSKDDNRIKFRIAAQEASRIQHIVPLSQLIVLTTGTEFRVTSVNSDAITPKSISVKPQSYIGASPVQPVIVNSSMVYAASRGGHVREFGYSYQAQGFVSGDLSLRASHLFERARVVSMTLQKAPDPIVWCAMSDGGLLGFTYMPDQGIGGWHRHDTVNGSFESVTCVTEGEQDVLYAVVRRRINGKDVRYLERMAESFNGEQSDAFYVDCGATYEGKPTKKITGLRWLEGETVAVLGDGAVYPHAVVKDGAIELDTPVSKAHVGLPIEADLKTLPVVLQVNDGSFAKGHMKNVNQLWAQVYQSSGFKAGEDFDHLVETKVRFEEPYGAPPALFSGEVSVVPTTAWKDDGAICIRQDKPLPLTIVGLTWQFM